MAESRTHVLTVKVSYPEKVGESDSTKIELSFRLPQWALVELNQINGVAVRARAQNHVLTVVTSCWSAYREKVLNLIANSNGNSLLERTSSGLPGYDVRIVEEVLTTKSTLLTFEAPTLSAAS